MNFRWRAEGPQWGLERVVILRGDVQIHSVVISSYSDSRFTKLIYDSFESPAYDEDQEMSVGEDAEWADFVRLACDLKRAPLPCTRDGLLDTLRMYLTHNTAADFNLLLADHLYYEEEQVIVFPRVVLNRRQWEQLRRALLPTYHLFRTWTHPMMTRGSAPLQNYTNTYVELHERDFREQKFSIFPSRAQIVNLDLCSLPTLPPLRLEAYRWRALSADQVVYASDRAVLLKNGQWYMFAKNGNMRRCCLLEWDQEAKWVHIPPYGFDEGDLLPTYERNTPQQDHLLRTTPPATHIGFGGRLHSQAFFGTFCSADLPADPLDLSVYFDSGIPFSIGSGGVTRDWMILRFTNQRRVNTDDVIAALTKLRELWSALFEAERCENGPRSWFSAEVMHADNDRQLFVHVLGAFTPPQWTLFEMCAHSAVYSAVNSRRRKSETRLSLQCLDLMPVIAARMPALFQYDFSTYLKFKARTATVVAMEASINDDVAAEWDLPAVLQCISYAMGSPVSESELTQRARFNRYWLTYGEDVGVKRNGYSDYYVATEQNRSGNYLHKGGEFKSMPLANVPYTDTISYLQRSIGANGLVKYDMKTGEFKRIRSPVEMWFSEESRQTLSTYLEVIEGRERVSERLEPATFDLDLYENDLAVTQVMGPTGAGKTTMILEVTRRWVARSQKHLVLFVSPRVGLNEQVVAKMVEQGLRVAYYKAPKETWLGAQVMVTTCHSLHRFVPDIEEVDMKMFVDPEVEQHIMCIVDEANTIFMEDLLDVTVLRPEQFELALANLLPSANLKHLILVDANLDPLLTENVLQRIRHSLQFHIGVPLHRRLKVVINTHRATFSNVRNQDRSATIFQRSSDLRIRIADLLRAGERVAVFCARKADANMLEPFYTSRVPNLRMKKITSDTPINWVELTREIEQNDIRLLLYTTVASAGIDLSFNDDRQHFSYVAMEGLNMSHLSFIQLYQAVSRVRNTSNLLMCSERVSVHDPFVLLTRPEVVNLSHMRPTDFLREYVSKRATFTLGLRNAIRATNAHQARLHRGHLIPHLARQPLPELDADDIGVHPFAVSYAYGSYYKFLFECRPTFVVSLLLRVGYRVYRCSEDDIQREPHIIEEYTGDIKSATLRASQLSLFGSEEALNRLENTEGQLLRHQVELFTSHLPRFNSVRERLQLPKIVFPPSMPDVVDFEAEDMRLYYANTGVVPSVENYLNKLPAFTFTTLDVLAFLCEQRPADEWDWLRCTRQIMDVHDSQLFNPQRTIILESLDSVSREKDRALLAALEIYCSLTAVQEPEFLPDRVEEGNRAVQLPHPVKLVEEIQIEMIAAEEWLTIVRGLLRNPQSVYCKSSCQFGHISKRHNALYQIAVREHLRLSYKTQRRTGITTFSDYEEQKWLKAFYYLWRRNKPGLVQLPDDSYLIPYVNCLKEFKRDANDNNNNALKPWDSADVRRIKSS